MKFLDVGQEATGFIAIGQMATGVIAIGQLATGVIAVGQIARGVFCVGMLTFGLFSFGMLNVGVAFAAGLLGVGGVAGKGAILPLVPWPRRFRLPRRVSLAAAMARPDEQVHVEAQVAFDGAGALMLLAKGQPVPARLHPELTHAADQAARKSPPMRLLCRLSPAGLGERTCDRLIALPPRPTPLIVAGFVQVAVLLVVSVAFWELVGVPLAELLLAARG